jgi:hypothetical protein
MHQDHKVHVSIQEIACQQDFLNQEKGLYVDIRAKNTQHAEIMNI